MSARPVPSDRPLAGRLVHDTPLAGHTSWRVGGPADRFYLPADAQDLVCFLQTLIPSEPIHWIGLGSNLLVRDGGIRGTVIATCNRFRAVRRLDERSVEAEAGAPCAHVARYCAERGLAGLEFLAGIPGTLGGALAMNAGAHGGAIWDRVAAVETVDRGGTVRWRGREDYRIGYRRVEGVSEEWFLKARFELDAREPGRCRETIRSLLAQRARTQPTNVPTCGSVFRNPDGDHAGRLIEAAGLKDLRIGGARVSPKHANFIENTGKATAADIETLIEAVRTRVCHRFGIRLETEVVIVGEQTGEDPA